MPLTKDELVILSSLLDEALDMPIDARNVWLKDTTTPNGKLKPLLKDLLARQASAETNDFLRTLPKFTQALDAERLPSSSPSILEGQTVGAYRLIREIGQGGMSTVWLATRVDGSINRPVALKLPHAHLSRNQFVQRFIRERDILATLTHPNIARLYDAGVTDNGQPFLVLEYIDGVAITDYSDSKRLSIRARIELFVQVLSAVQFAHSHLIIHRDLKPSNILVTQPGQVALLDFGIAKLITDGVALETQLTQLGGRALTPDYASPEQITGESLSTASDVYSLGVVLYELLTGARPYKLKRDSRGALEEAILSAEAQRPSQTISDISYAEQRSTTVKKLSTILRGDLDTIVLKAIKKIPVDRYSTVDAFRLDLECYLSGHPVQAKSDSLWYRSKRYLVRNRYTLGAVSAIVLSLLVGLGIATWQARTARRQADLAHREAEKAKAVQGFLLNIFEANADNQKDPVAARQTTARQLLDIGAQRVNEALKSAPDSQQEVLMTLSDMYNDLGLDTEAAALQKQRIAVLKQLYGPRDIRLVEPLIAFSANLHATNQRELILPTLDDAKSILDEHPDADPRKRGELYLRYAERYQVLSYDKMIENADKAIAIFRTIKSSERTNLSTALHFAARGRALRGDYVGAEEMYKEVLSLFSNLDTTSDLDLIPTLVYLGDAQLQLVKVHEAEETYHRAVDRGLKHSGKLHPTTILAENRLARFLNVTSRRPEARSLCAENLVDVIQAKGEDDTLYTPTIRAMCGRNALSDGNIEQAARLFSQVISTNRIHYANTSTLAANLRDEGTVLTIFGKYREAEQDFEEATAMWNKTSGNGATPAMSNSYLLARAQLLLTTGNASQAIAVAERVAAPLHVEQLPLGIDELTAKLLVSRADLQLGRTTEALQLAQTTLASLEQSTVRNYFQSLEADAAYAVGLAELATNHAKNAANHLQTALRLRMANDVANSPYIAEIQVALANCYLDSNGFAQAKAFAAKATSIYATHKDLGAQYNKPLRDLQARIAKIQL